MKTVPNYKLAAYVVAQRGTLWLKGASVQEMSHATNAACEFHGISQDTRQAVTCLRSIREYVIAKNVELPA